MINRLSDDQYLLLYRRRVKSKGVKLLYIYIYIYLFIFTSIRLLIRPRGEDEGRTNIASRFFYLSPFAVRGSLIEAERYPFRRHFNKSINAT